MSFTFPKGSEWRKWDLHVHLPGTKLSNGYTRTDGSEPLDKFCDMIEGSDVAVIGITDYFSVDEFFNFLDKFYTKYPDSSKVFFPNIELRLNESVNPAQEEVHIHVILPPDITKEKATEFLSKLKTETTDGNGRHKTCSELATASEYKAATVTRGNLEEAIHLAFGIKDRQEHLLIVTAANNDGVRPARGSRRKENITDEIDKFSDGFFGGSQNTDHFLQTTRFEDNGLAALAKPVYSGSDAHNFADLTSWLGKSIADSNTKKEVTWIKANPTFAGLQQTLIEPEERVKIQDLEPDQKEPYKRISKVTFSGTNDFPAEIVFNSNFASIIGSRSSGKSALLAYIAHTVDPEDTVTRQMAAQEEQDRSKIGPAAGKTWSGVSAITCQVQWAVGESATGRVIYIPQNYLYSISKRPDEITKKIEPVLFARYPDTKTQYDKTTTDVAGANETIRTATAQWFDYDKEARGLQADIINLGDKKAVEAARTACKAQIDEMKKHLSLSQEDIEKYQEISGQISQNNTRLTSIASEKGTLAPFYDDNGTSPKVQNINPDVTFRPTLYNLPVKLSDEINTIIETTAGRLKTEVEVKILAYRRGLDQEAERLTQEIVDIQGANSELIEKNQQNVQLAKLVADYSHQSVVITSIETKEDRIKDLGTKKQEQVEKINGAVLTRSEAFRALNQVFSATLQERTEMTFGVEIDFGKDDAEEVTSKYNRQENSPYIQDDCVDFTKLRREIGSFLDYMNTSQKLRTGQEKKQVAIASLCTTERIRFTALLEGDKIGGFLPSSMTPGKQALFALTLILDESDDAWPLLIDQPEDDLDSRSIYEYIVPYLIERKRERQILMVSHNANLVIGADSEQIIVANRHGADRKNKDGKTFDYLTGAIEDSKPKIVSQHILETCGIREHAIDILDGGKEAFEKRKNKYKI